MDPEITATDRAWTEEVIEVASAARIGIREDSGSRGIAFTWRIPGAGNLHCRGERLRHLALMRACHRLCEQLSLPHVHSCPRWFV